MSEKREVQTDKDKTKDCPCTYPGCDVICVVNTFYAPAKARCKEHENASNHRVASTRLVEAAKDAPPAPPNGALANMRCPLCQNLLIIEQLEDPLTFIAFRCSDSHCLCAVKIKPHWGHMFMPKIATKFREIADAINAAAKASRL